MIVPSHDKSSNTKQSNLQYSVIVIVVFVQLGSIKAEERTTERYSAKVLLGTASERLYFLPRASNGMPNAQRGTLYITYSMYQVWNLASRNSEDTCVSCTKFYVP